MTDYHGKWWCHRYDNPEYDIRFNSNGKNAEIFNNVIKALCGLDVIFELVKGYKTSDKRILIANRPYKVENTNNHRHFLIVEGIYNIIIEVVSIEFISKKNTAIVFSEDDYKESLFKYRSLGSIYPSQVEEEKVTSSSNTPEEVKDHPKCKTQKNSISSFEVKICIHCRERIEDGKSLEICCHYWNIDHLRSNVENMENISLLPNKKLLPCGHPMKIKIILGKLIKTE